jgi:hypothetical protein
MISDRTLPRSFHSRTKYLTAKRRELESGMFNSGVSNRDIAKQFGVDEVTIRNDRKVIDMPAGELRKPCRPREWRPRYDPLDPESREKISGSSSEGSPGVV